MKLPKLPFKFGRFGKDTEIEEEEELEDDLSDYEEDEEDEDEDEKRSGFNLDKIKEAVTRLLAAMEADRRLMFLFVGIGFVIFVVIIGGGGWYVYNTGFEEKAAPDQEQSAPSPLAEGSVLTPPPSRKRRSLSGSLNALGKDQPEKPAEPEKPVKKKPGTAPAGKDLSSGGEIKAEGTVSEKKIQKKPKPLKKAKPLNTVTAGTASPKGGLNAIISSQATPGGGLVIIASTRDAFKNMPPVPAETPLSAAPDPALLEKNPDGTLGKLPVIAKDGRMARTVYARPTADTGDKPKVAVIVSGLGLSRAVTMAAIRQLPGAVTLAFDVYAPGLDKWVARARKSGHEVLLTLPMEPDDFPYEDPGPLGLFSNLDEKANLSRLKSMLERMPGYVGLLTVMGSKFSSVETLIKPVLEVLNKRGLIIVDGSGGKNSAIRKITKEIGLPHAFGELMIGENLSQAAVEEQLSKFESTIRDRSSSLVIASPSPSALNNLSFWVKGLKDSGIVLAPVSAITDKQAVK